MIAPNQESQPLQKLLAQLARCEPSIRRMPNGDDVFQEVCFRCVASASTRDWSQTQYGFIHQVARRVLIDQRRKASLRQTTPLQSTPEIESRVDGPVETAYKREIESRVRDQIQWLPPSQQEVIHACLINGLSVGEIARLLHVPLETVKSRKKRGLAKLRSDPVIKAYSEGGF